MNNKSWRECVEILPGKSSYVLRDEMSTFPFLPLAEETRSGERETESRLIDLFFCRCKKTNQQNLTPKAGKLRVEDVKDTLKTLSPSPAPALSAQSINNTATFI